jgi:hypothetical protein
MVQSHVCFLHTIEPRPFPEIDATVADQTDLTRSKAASSRAGQGSSRACLHIRHQPHLLLNRAS